MGDIADIRCPRESGALTVLMLATDWGVTRVPDRIASLYDHAQTSASVFSRLDEATPLGRALRAWERRQVQRCNEAQALVELEGDLTPYLEAEKAA